MFTGPEDLSDIYQFVNKWESAFGLKLTEEAYVEFEQADVNNYKAKDSHGNVIVKGKKFKDAA
jgi:hypothetical protein